jgi:hypothetical protein
MEEVRAIFDGKVIHVPETLRDAPPGEVIIRFKPRKPKPLRNLLDIIGVWPHPRSDAELDAYLRAERDSWDRE